MPKWSGRWKGGRFYVNEDGKPVYFIERRVSGQMTTIKLATHDEEIARGELGLFKADPEGYLARRDRQASPRAVFMTPALINGYLESIRKTCKDHYAARRSYLAAWSERGHDLRTVQEDDLRKSLDLFTGGHRGRTEAINAFANWLVRKRVLLQWTTLINHIDTPNTRAPQEAYSVEQLQERYRTLKNARQRDLFLLRAETGLHYTEVRQLVGCRVQKGPLSDKGVAIRTLEGDHEIRGVIQILHKSGKRHRQSVGARALEAALRLREKCPARDKAWKLWDPIVPSNLRHTFVTLAGEVGRVVQYKGSGISRSIIAQTVGHRAGSTMTADHYDKLQVPSMVVLPIVWPDVESGGAATPVLGSGDTTGSPDLAPLPSESP